MADITVSELATALEGFRLDGIDVTGRTISVEVADADEFAGALHATLGRMAALREPLPMSPGAPDVRPLEDPELIAAQQILDALAPLETADPAAVLRVLRWARERYDL